MVPLVRLDTRMGTLLSSCRVWWRVPIQTQVRTGTQPSISDDTQEQHRLPVRWPVAQAVPLWLWAGELCLFLTRQRNRL